MLRQPSMADGGVGYLGSGRGLTRALVTVWFNLIKSILTDLTACHILWSSQHELSGRIQTWFCNFCQPGQILQLYCLDWFSLLHPSPSSAHTWSAKVGPIHEKSCSSNHYPIVVLTFATIPGMLWRLFSPPSGLSSSSLPHVLCWVNLKTSGL